MATRKKTLKNVNFDLGAEPITVVDNGDGMYATMALNDFLAGRDIAVFAIGADILIPYHAVQSVFVTENVISTEVTDAFCADGE